MYVIIEGTVAVVQEHRQIGVLGEHNYFCENSILQPQRLGSYGQLCSRTHFAVDGPAIVGALGYEDFQQLRRDRPEINDAVKPCLLRSTLVASLPLQNITVYDSFLAFARRSRYIQEMVGRQTSQKLWFYVEIHSAENLCISDAGTLESKGSSDPYCCMFFNNRLIGKTDVVRNSLNPKWRKSFAMTRSEVAAAQAGESQSVEFRFEVYDYDIFGDPDLLGQATATVTDLSKEEHFDDWTESSEDVETVLEMTRADGKPALGEDDSNSLLKIRLCNNDAVLHTSKRLKVCC
eukprot:COSAG02_NODE_5264_length_4487_cov_1.615998_3_plen_291_part_00